MTPEEFCLTVRLCTRKGCLETRGVWLYCKEHERKAVANGMLTVRPKTPLPRVPRKVKFSTAPIWNHVERVARNVGMTVDEYLGEGSVLRRSLYRGTLGITATDSACAALGLHATELFGNDFYQGLEGA